MEIVLAVLLFFGGFTLGSVTADKKDDDGHSTVALSHGYGVPDSFSTKQAMRQHESICCYTDKGVIYRDLTVPYRGQVDEKVSHAGGCEGDYPDE